MEYKPKPPKQRGRVLLDRRRPFEMFLKLGGSIYTVHCQIGRLVITWEEKYEYVPGARKVRDV